MADTKGRDIPDDDEQDLPVMTKLAILCVALGPEAAGEVLKSLGEHEVEEVQLRIVQQVRRLEEQGQLKLAHGDSKDSLI